jgi:hypothetical protein
VFKIGLRKYCEVHLLESVQFFPFLLLRRKCRYRMFENKLPTGIFGTKTEEETKRCRKFLKEMLHNLYSSPNGDIRTIK